jgi:septal ring factor EnvC (AmiA/AmiB activator)
MELHVVERFPSKGIPPSATVVDEIRHQIQEQSRILSIFIEKSNSLEIKVEKVEKDNKNLNETVSEFKIQLDKSHENNRALQKHVQQMEIERAELLSYIEVLREALKNQHRNSLT